MNRETARPVTQGGAKPREEKKVIADANREITVENGMIVWAGKKKFCRVTLVD
ncbi:MAG: hypothetical protein R3C19_06000 [Planctomycetaceae bacterium]